MSGGGTAGILWTYDFNSQLDQLDYSSTTDSWEVQVGFTYRFRPLRFRPAGVDWSM